MRKTAFTGRQAPLSTKSALLHTSFTRFPLLPAEKTNFGVPALMKTYLMQFFSLSLKPGFDTHFN